ncbi:MAG: TIR domain-containing protein [Bacteroidales bacterium]|nr:TIR domain-containing protein [Bacteroidales bacterium]
MTPTTKQYYAFISYKRDDQKWAEWLQEKLEHYKLPTNLNGRSDLPKEIRPVFRDKSELAAGVLADEIQKALDNSKYLIVICSPHSAKSEWVNKEVQAFIESGRTDKIIPFIIEGTPNSGNDETECFPKAIRELPAEDELLGVNINEMGRDAAAVKVVAQMFGLRFDDLWQRHEREKKRKRHLITAGITAFAFAVICVAGWIWHQNVLLKKQRWEMLENQSRFVSEKVYSEIINNPDLVQNIASVILPKDIENPDRPYTAEAERVLRKTFEYKPCFVKGYNNSLYAEARFSEDGTKFMNRRRWNLLNPGLTVLDAETGSELQRIESSDYGFADIRIDGKQAIVMNDSIFKIIDVETGDEIRTFDQYNNIEAVTYYCDDIVVVFNKQDQLFTINVATGQELNIGYLESMFFDVSPNGQKSFYYEYNSNDTETINIVDINNGETHSWIVDEKFDSGIFNYDGKILLTNLGRGEMAMWDVETGKKLKTMNLSDGKQAMPLALSPDGKLLAIVYINGIVKIWNVDTLNVIDVFELGGTVINDFHGTFSPDGKKLAVCSDNIIKIVEIETNVDSNVIAKVDGVNDDYDKSNIFVEHNIVEYYNIYDFSWYIFDITTKTGKQRTMEPDELFFNYKYRFYKTDDYTIVACNDTNGDTLYKIVSDNIIKDEGISRDGKLICLLSYDSITDNGCVQMSLDFNMFDIETGEKTRHLGKNIVFNGTCIHIGDISYDNNYMALLYGNDIFDTEFLAHGLVIINLLTGEETPNIVIENSYHNKMYLSPDGRYFVTYSNIYPSCPRIGDARSGAKITEIDGVVWNQYPFSPDGCHILSKIDEKKFNVYDIKTGGCVYTIERDNDVMSGASFTDDGRHIITVSTNGTIRVWDFPPLQDLIDQTRERFKNRPLTEEEKKMYYLE